MPLNPTHNFDVMLTYSMLHAVSKTQKISVKVYGGAGSKWLFTEFAVNIYRYTLSLRLLEPSRIYPQSFHNSVWKGLAINRFWESIKNVSATYRTWNSETAVTCTAKSFTHHCDMHSGVIDTAVHVTVVSMW
jgi:hypothetical protein